jgi:hypothetical protein
VAPATALYGRLAANVWKNTERSFLRRVSTMVVNALSRTLATATSTTTTTADSSKASQEHKTGTSIIIDELKT